MSWVPILSNFIFHTKSFAKAIAAMENVDDVLLSMVRPFTWAIDIWGRCSFWPSERLNDTFEILRISRFRSRMMYILSSHPPPPLSRLRLHPRELSRFWSRLVRVRRAAGLGGQGAAEAEAQRPLLGS